MPDSITSVFLTKPVTIAINTSLSGVIDLDGFNIFAIEMPSAWDAANITFQACSTVDGTFQNLYDDSGAEVTVTAAAARVIAVDANMLKIAPIRYIKLRSGTAASAVNQTAARTITLICKG